MNSLFDRLRARAGEIRRELGTRVGAARREIQRNGVRGIPRAARTIVSGTQNT